MCAAIPGVTMPRTPYDARGAAETIISKKCSVWPCQPTIEWLKPVVNTYAALSRNQDPMRTSHPSITTRIKPLMAAIRVRGGPHNLPPADQLDRQLGAAALLHDQDPKETSLKTGEPRSYRASLSSISLFS